MIAEGELNGTRAGSELINQESADHQWNWFAEYCEVATTAMNSNRFDLNLHCPKRGGSCRSQRSIRRCNLDGFKVKFRLTSLTNGTVLANLVAAQID
jgi:hypothetical protein